MNAPNAVIDEAHTVSSALTGGPGPLPSKAPGEMGPRMAIGPMDEATKVEIDKLHRRNVSLDVLACQFGRSRQAVVRAVTEMRARRLLEAKIEFMPHPSFDEPKAHVEILSPMPVPADGKAPRKVRARKAYPRIWRTFMTRSCSIASKRRIYSAR